MSFTINFEYLLLNILENAFYLSNVVGTRHAIERNLAMTRNLRQSILKYAFEGKLVSQNPSDEPAELLLKKIKIDKMK